MRLAGLGLVLAALVPKVPKVKAPADDGVDWGEAIANLFGCGLTIFLVVGVAYGLVHWARHQKKKDDADLALRIEESKRRTAEAARVAAYQAHQAQQAVAAPVSTHIIERQTVVVRCKFCQGLTPVDAGTCQQCGAGSFS